MGSYCCDICGESEHNSNNVDINFIKELNVNVDGQR